MKRRRKPKRKGPNLPKVLRRAGLRLRTPPPKIHVPETVYRRQGAKRRDRTRIDEELER
jgi:hypothetical protein